MLDTKNGAGVFLYSTKTGNPAPYQLVLDMSVALTFLYSTKTEISAPYLLVLDMNMVLMIFVFY